MSQLGDAPSSSNVKVPGQSLSDPRQFGDFYEHHFESVLSFFWTRTRDRSVAADLTAETFAAAIAGLQSFDPTIGDPGAWLFGIAKNQLNVFWRKRRVAEKARLRLSMQPVEQPTGGWGSIESIDAGLDSERLALALEELPKRYREAVHLRVVAEQSYEEIAGSLGCKPGAARVRVFRGLKALQQVFDSAKAGDR